MEPKLMLAIQVKMVTNESGATPLEVAEAAGNDEAMSIVQYYIDQPPV